MDQKKIGKYIADKRKALELTQVALAEMLGVSDKSVSKWERGVCLPDVSKYQELCETLGISLNELFAGEDLKSENVVYQSEQNIISVAKTEKEKRKQLLKIIMLMAACIVILAGGYIANFNFAKDDNDNRLAQLKYGITTADENYTHYDIDGEPLVGITIEDDIETVTKKSYVSMSSMIQITVTQAYYDSYEQAVADDKEYKYSSYHEYTDNNGPGIKRIICGRLENGGAMAWIYTDRDTYTMRARTMYSDDEFCEDELHFFLNGVSIDETLEDEIWRE